MNKSILKAGLVISALSVVNCAQKNNQASSSSYNTSFAMSSSSQQTVALLSPFEKMFQFFQPKANAAIPSSMQDSLGTSVTLSAAWIVVKEVEFKAAEIKGTETEDEATEEVKFRGPYFVNLLSATAQVLDTQLVPAKTYRRVEMKLEAAENSSSAQWPTGSDAPPTELSNNSIYLAGVYGTTNFSFSSNDGTEFKVSGANGISPEEGQTLLLSIRFADIIRKIDLTALATAGSTDISDSNRVTASNPCPSIEVGLTDIFTCIRKGLESEADIGKDSDHSGELESDEDKASN